MLDPSLLLRGARNRARTCFALSFAVAVLGASVNEARAGYPDTEAWALAPASPWTIYCSETLDSTDTISSGFWNPSQSVSRPCNGGGSITDAAGDIWDTVPASGTVPLPSGATIARVLRVDNTVTSSGATVRSFPENASFPVPRGRFAHRFYLWFSQATTPIPANWSSGAARKYVEMQFDRTVFSGNQAQGADPKDGTGSFHMFFSAPGASASCAAIGNGGKGVTRVGGQGLSLSDCKSMPCRVEQAATWDGTNFSIEYKVTKVNADGTDGAFDERRGTCQPGTTLSKWGPGGAFINNFVDVEGRGPGFYRYLSLYVAAYTTDTTLGRWIGPATEIQGGGGTPGLGTPGKPTLVP